MALNYSTEHAYAIVWEEVKHDVDERLYPDSENHQLSTNDHGLKRTQRL